MQARRNSKTLGIGRDSTKHDKVRHRKIDPECCQNRDKLRHKDISVVGENNEGGGRDNYPKNTRGSEAEVMLPTERATGFPTQGNLRVHSVGSRGRDCPCNDVRQNEWQVKEFICNREYSDVNGNIYDTDRREAKQFRNDRSTAPRDGNLA
jgi:hypothetical protein